MRRLFAGIVVAVSFVAQAAVAAPLHLLDEVKALECCESHCEHSHEGRDAAKCCGIEGAVDELLPSGATKLPATTRVSSPVALAVEVSSPGCSAHRLLPAPYGRAAPLFLLTRSLLI